MIWPEAFFRVVKLWSISTRLKDPFQATLMRSPDAISRELITCDQKNAQGITGQIN